MLRCHGWVGAPRAGALHQALAKLRAVERRKHLVCATNRGLTAVIAPTGQVVAQLPEGKVSAAQC
jgi:apolipoprotein N-acyltransferase